MTFFAERPSCVSAALVGALALAMRPHVGGAQDTPVGRAARQPPVLTAFRLNDGASAVAADSGLHLAHAVVGATPSAYRVSERADFAGASWHPYVARPLVAQWASLMRPGCGGNGATAQVKLFLQVRAALGDEVKIVNGQRVLVAITAESNVLTDSICVITPYAER